MDIKLNKFRTIRTHVYNSGDSQLERISAIGDLRVITDSKVTFVKHLDFVVGKACFLVICNLCHCEEF